MLLVGSVLTTFTNPMISALADSLQAQKALMLLSAGGQAVCQLAMLAPGLGYRGLLVLVTAHKFIGEHAFPIMDASTMVTCGDHYGPIRLYGAIGFGAAAFGGGGLISLAGSPNARSNFVTAFAFASIMQIISLPLISRLDFSALQVCLPVHFSGRFWACWAFVTVRLTIVCARRSQVMQLRNPQTLPTPLRTESSRF